jgi:acyl-CoA synthetase (NDP forming)
MIPEYRVKEWISGFGVRVPRGVTAPDPAAVVAAARDLTPPFAVKAFGPGLVHKSEAGAVRLNVGSPAEAAAAAATMPQLDGFLVEEMAPAGVEVIVGAVRDPAFGPAVLVGLGGVWTEVLRDTALRLCPIGPDDAREMLEELRGRPLLAGFRGAPPVDVAALAEVICRVSDALTSLGDRFAPGAELELNPVICDGDGAVAVDARLIGVDLDATPAASPAAGPAADTDFGTLFAPRAVAVVGASTSRPNFGNMFLGFYRAMGGGPRLVAVHPTAADIDGVPCVPSLADAKADYALVAVPAARCPEVVSQAAGVAFVQVMSGGFRETGAADLQADLLAVIPDGTRLLGPNCMGVYSPAGGQTFIGGEQGVPGRISLISQSGGMAGEVIRVGERRGLTFAKAATVGNSADVAPAELLTYLSGDEATSVIGLYLEDPRGGRDLFEALRACAKPVVLLVGGRSAQGRRAAVSHTGAMVDDTRMWEALSRQTRTPLVRSQDDLIGALDFLDLHGGRAVAADGVLVIGPSGGAGVLAADAFDAAGVPLRALPPVNIRLPVGAIAANPMEIGIGPRGAPSLIADVIREVPPFGDYVVHMNVQNFYTFGDGADPLLAYTVMLGELQREHPRSRFTLVLRNVEYAPPGVEEEVRSTARADGVPVFRSMEAAASAVAAGRWHDA